MIKLTVVTVFLFCVISIGLLSVKTQIQEKEAHLYALQKSIQADRKEIRVLKAEWSHLNDPTRIKRLADAYLKLSPVGAGQIASISALPYGATETSPSRSANQPAPAPRKPFFGSRPELASRGDGM